ncbi:MAG: hypothetical protein GY757_53755, partial [bacterium]|nr:hypothetical protein [bacterium]
MDTSQVPVAELPGIMPEEAGVDTRGQDTADVLDMILASENIAGDLTDMELAELADRVIKDFQIDKNSRAVWEKTYGEAMELARQLYEKKTWGGEEVANIKYPIIGTAAIQYNARAYGNLVKGENYVNTKVYGRDPQGLKAARAQRVSDHMNYQLGIEMPDWEEEMDQLLIYLPIVGCGFKKTYRDFSKNMNISAFVTAEDLVVNYWAKNLETASRITHIVEMSKNEAIENIRSNMFLDIEKDLEQMSKGRTIDTKIDNQGEPDPQESEGGADEDAPVVFYEQHRWWDLDGDGYKEPYIVTVHKDTMKVVRMTARWTQESVIRHEKTDKVIRIDPIHHFTQYNFFPAFDGNFYRMGFGILLSPINKTVNTIINQLLDAGTLANRQSGFINQGIRITKSGATGYLRFKPGEWKFVQSPGDDIRKNILPLPLKEPSATLFQLLGLMLEASKELASQSEVLSGEQTQPNVPATTTLALIEQGLKVFASVYKRTYQGQKKEYTKIRRLNYLYTDNEDYNNLLDTETYVSAKLDYNDKDLDISPISGTADVSDIQKLIKSQALMELRGQGLDD